MRPLIREFRIAYYELALRSIDPMHRDMPYIVIRLNQLVGERS